MISKQRVPYINLIIRMSFQAKLIKHSIVSKSIKGKEEVTIQLTNQNKSSNVN